MIPLRSPSIWRAPRLQTGSVAEPVFRPPPKASGSEGGTPASRLYHGGQALGRVFCLGGNVLFPLIHFGEPL